jgi:hypothetical protein
LSYTYLRFPDIKDFIRYLQKCEIHSYGLIQRRKIWKGFQAFLFRLTAKNPKEMVIATCDITFMQGWEIDFNPEVYKGKKEKALAEIHEAFKGQGDYTEVEAEHTAKARTEFPL